LIDGWRRLNPDYQIILWNEDNIDFSFEFVQTAYATRAWNRVANFVRVWALLKHGGIYLDTDIELRRPLDDLLFNRCFAGFQLAQRHVDWVNNAVIGAEPGHWFIERLHRCFVDDLKGWQNVGSGAGPGLLTRMLTAHGLSSYLEQPQQLQDVTLYPRRWFYPYSWMEGFSEDCVTSDTYAIHHWDHTWAPQQGVTAKIKRGLLRELARRHPQGSCDLMRAYVLNSKRRRGGQATCIASLSSPQGLIEPSGTHWITRQESPEVDAVRPEFVEG
jgi:mannosyltransferase OCH1-like enzyme